MSPRLRSARSRPPVLVRSEPVDANPAALWQRILHQSQHAQQRGKQLPIPTRHEVVTDAGVGFLVRVVTNPEEKSKQAKAAPGQGEAGQPRANPFLPFDEDLCVGAVSHTHVALLNKYNVVDHHILIVTKHFEHQLSPLTVADFQAAHSCLTQYSALAFYNAGELAGASQTHKHLQVVPLPLGAAGPALPIEPLLVERQVAFGRITAAALPFRHALVRLRSAGAGAAAAHKLYQQMLLDLALGSGAAGQPTAPYNLLLTRDFMLLVPRSREAFGRIPINALGFAGALLVRNEADLELLKARGPMVALRHVATAWT
jgi:ATP adenylyltransferase